MKRSEWVSGIWAFEKVCYCCRRTFSGKALHTKKVIAKKDRKLLLPLYGSSVFMMLYFIAARYYPGGSQADAAATGFSWLHNYWCNLLNESAMNGQPNAARPIAMAAMGVLCATLLSFWILFPQQATLPKRMRHLMQVSAILCVTTGLFISTGFHDLLLDVASFFGLIATAGIFAGLHKLKWQLLFRWGVFNIGLVILNNILYYGNGLLYLPVVQKITFLSFLLWIGFISVKMYQAQRGSLCTEELHKN